MAFVMANKNDKISANVPGAFYVDHSCTDCDLCRESVPEVFRRDDSIGYTFVHRQPQTAEQIAAAVEAMKDCPTDSIGNDG